jgi:hypothetical protein
VPAPRLALTAVAVAGVLGLSGCGNLITRDLTPPQPSTSASSAAGTPASSPVKATSSPSTATTAPATPTTKATSPAPTPSGSSTPVPPSTTAGLIASGLVTPPQVASVHGGVWALGDSFLLGSARVLKANHVRVDAKVGRQFFEGINELRTAAHSGSLPRNVVIHLGTNGSVTNKQCDSVFNYVGPNRRVFLVTVIGPRSWMKPDDVVLKACAKRHATQAVIVDWAGVSASHPEYFGPDRVHPNPKGRPVYNALILGALKKYAI